MTVPAKKSILFIDDDKDVLTILELVMQRASGEWDAHYASGGPEGMALIEQKVFDVVVCDMRMPRINGMDVLTALMKKQPRTIRVIMSGHADEEIVQESIGIAHQWMTKPFELATLTQMLTRISTAASRLQSDPFKALVGRIRHIPSSPQIYFQILEAQQSPSCSTQTIAEIVVRDPGLATSLLKLINSAFFGPSRHVTDPTEAVQFLGVSRIRSLTLMHHLVSQFDRHTFHDLSLDELWAHSLQTAFWARRFATWHKASKRVQDEAFTGGLLNDIGHIILAANLPQDYREIRGRARTRHLPWHEAERQLIGTTHAELGSYLLGIWGLPPVLTDIVARHEEPGSGGTEPVFTPLAAVHVASIWSYAKMASAKEIPPAPLDADYLAAAGLSEDVASWRDRLLMEE